MLPAPFIEKTHMSHRTFGAGFSALTEEEQVSLVGGDGTLAHMIGYGLGFAVHWIEAGLIIGRAMDPTIHGSVAYGYLAAL
jgi:hypothetical protein